jgi:hypothetical protein
MLRNLDGGRPRSDDSELRDGMAVLLGHKAELRSLDPKRSMLTLRRQHARRVGCSVEESWLGLLQAKADRRRGRAFRSVRCAAAWAEYRHQQFGRFAAHGTIGLYRSEAGRRGIALLALVTRRAFFTGYALLAWRTLRPLRSLCAGLALGAGDSLNALGALRSGRTLRARLTLRTRRSGIPAASAERKRKTNDEYGNDSHDVPPDD